MNLILELADKDFKISVINMIKIIEEKIEKVDNITAQLT